MPVGRVTFRHIEPMGFSEYLVATYRADFAKYGSRSQREVLADQLVAQQLRLAVGPSPVGLEVFYWQRHGGRAGEIDFLVQVGGRILPVEVKAGAAGAMKSLHQFMRDKGLDLALRCDTNPPSTQALSLSTTTGQAVSYRLLNLPHYLVWNLTALVGAL